MKASLSETTPGSAGFLEGTGHADWLGPCEIKYATTGVTRTIKPEATIRRATGVLDVIGVTKVAEVTNLDRIGIPNFMTVRPRDRGPGISYYNGKGTTRADAHAGALMEAVERHAGEDYDGPIITGSFAGLRHRYHCVDPRAINVPTTRPYDDDLVLEWVSGFDLLNRRLTLAPLNCIVCPYTPRSGATLFYTSTNGLASGNTRLEALCHALCEVIERDAASIAMAGRQLRPAVAALLSDIGFTRLAERRSSAPLIALNTLPPRAARLVRKFHQTDLKVYLRNLTCTAGIPTIDCTIAERSPTGVPNAHGGTGTHPDARVALTRALTEAAQSRVACIQGGREDLPEIIRSRTPCDVDLRFGGGEEIAFSDIVSYEHPSINEDVELILQRLSQSGFGQVLAFDLTRPEVGIPVVRVLVPNAEAWTIFYLHAGRGVFGDRVLDELEA
jgi:ribosomal protein S12 methylthiotransferase accessory factor